MFASRQEAVLLLIHQKSSSRSAGVCRAQLGRAWASRRDSHGPASRQPISQPRHARASKSNLFLDHHDARLRHSFPFPIVICLIAQDSRETTTLYHLFSSRKFSGWTSHLAQTKLVL